MAFDFTTEMIFSLQTIQMAGAQVASVVRQDPPEYATLYDGIVESLCSALFKSTEILNEYLDDEKSAHFAEKTALDLKFYSDKYLEWNNFIADYLDGKDQTELDKKSHVLDAIELLDKMRTENALDGIPEEDPEMLLRAWNDYLEFGRYGE